MYCNNEMKVLREKTRIWKVEWKREDSRILYSSTAFRVPNYFTYPGNLKLWLEHLQLELTNFIFRKAQELGKEDGPRNH